ncbi:RNA polymerase III subunit C82 [Rhizopus stolonifer]|uniref:DNA-directed RNA polymerase III subunit RPC3 n=1 Tax=Rhizopus stolonifer TaxID=4846 RepID=A0A367KF05_RHIST|nr:RNA polymerase III subunit C82 [Rhizopus stolonifer]
MSFEARLCRDIVKEDFGEHSAFVVHELVLKGRSTLHDLARFTTFSVKRVREVLVALIQHSLVYFSEPTEGKPRDATYYEVNTNQILMRLRMGRMMRVTEERYGKTGSAICQLLFLNGKVKLSQVQAWARTNDTKDKDEATYTKTFTKMAMDQFITAVLPQHSRSVMDQFLDAEQKELAKYTITTASDLATIKLTAKNNVQAVFEQNEYIGIKRKAVDTLASEAKRFSQDTSLDQEDKKKELIYEIDPTMFFAFNYHKYNLYFRNLMMADFAITKINKTAGIVIKTFFRHGRDKMKDIKEDYSPSTTASHIANMLEPEVFKRGDLVLPGQPSPPVIQVVEGYFQLLRSGGFLALRDELGANQYAVNFKRLRYLMKRHILEGCITDRFGVACCRIVRILLDKGKLDESQIQKLSMLPLKNVRHKLEKCFAELLQDVYRTLGNLQQRKNEELLRRVRLLDKLSRQDVIENMTLLNEIDRVELAKMEKVVERLETSKERLDEMIMILKDF